jgi:hypothetical protein
MSVSVPFNGQSFSIPEDEETGWEDLTDFLVALALSAATTTSMSFSTRVATTSPQTLQAGDTILGMNVGAPSVVNLPSGVAKQFYGVGDVSGAAFTNPITITPTGGQLINGQSSYVLRSNFGFVFLHFNGQQWVVVSEVSNVFKSARRIENVVANTSFVEGSITSAGALATAANLQAASASFEGSNSMLIAVALDSGESLLLHTSLSSDVVTAISDPAGLFLTSDAGVGLVVTKAAASSTVTFKNRTGAPKQIEIKALSNRLASVTAWA